MSARINKIRSHLTPCLNAVPHAAAIASSPTNGGTNNADLWKPKLSMDSLRQDTSTRSNGKFSVLSENNTNVLCLEMSNQSSHAWHAASIEIPPHAREASQLSLDFKVSKLGPNCWYCNLFFTNQKGGIGGLEIKFDNKILQVYNAGGHICGTSTKVTAKMVSNYTERGKAPILANQWEKFVVHFDWPAQKLSFHVSGRRCCEIKMNKRTGPWGKLIAIAPKGHAKGGHAYWKSFRLTAKATVAAEASNWKSLPPRPGLGTNSIFDKNVTLDKEGSDMHQEIAEVAHGFLPILEKLKEAWKEFHRSRLRSIDKIRSCYSTIDYHHQNGKIATTAGASAGIIGGLLTLGGVLAAPFTGGVSLLAIGVGSAVAASGAITQFGSDQAVASFIEDEADKAKPILEKDRAVWLKLSARFEELAAYKQTCVAKLKDSPNMTAAQKVEFGLEIAKQAKNLLLGVGKGVYNSVQAVGLISKYGLATIGFGRAAMTAEMSMQLSFMGVVSSASKWTGISMKLGAAGAKIAVKATAVLAVVGVALDAVAIVGSIKSLVNGSLHQLSEQLRKILAQLDDQYKNIHACCSSLGIIDPTYIIWNRSTNKVLDLAGNNFKNGTNILLWEMHGEMSQVWSLHDGGIQHVGSGKMVDVSGGSKKNGANIILWEGTKSGGAGWNQKWTAKPNGTLVNPTLGTAMDIYGGHSANGTNVISWQAHGGVNQKWEIIKRVYIQNTQTGKVLDCRYSGTENGTNIWLWPINGTPAQIWGIMSDGTIMHIATGKCLDVEFMSANVQLWDRDESRGAQKWEIHENGSITLISNDLNNGKELDTVGTRDGANVRVQSAQYSHGVKFRTLCL